MLPRMPFASREGHYESEETGKCFNRKFIPSIYRLRQRIHQNMQQTYTHANCFGGGASAQPPPWRSCYPPTHPLQHVGLWPPIDCLGIIQRRAQDFGNDPSVTQTRQKTDLGMGGGGSVGPFVVII